MSEPSGSRLTPAGSEPASGGRPPQPLTYSVGKDVHILDRLAVVYRYRRIAFSVFALTTIALMIQGYSNQQLFQAKAQVLIEDERSTAMPGISAADYYQDPVPYYNTQYRILRGRDLARRVVKDINLQNVAEFNGTAKPAATPVSMARDAGDRLPRFLTRTPPPVLEAPTRRRFRRASALRGPAGACA